MFCIKCGKPIDMDKNLCDECAALEQAQAAAEQSAQPEVILPAEQPAEVAEPMEEAAAPAEQTVSPEYIAPPEQPAFVPEAQSQPEYCPPLEQQEAAQDSIVLEQDFGKPQKKKGRAGLVIGILAAVVAAAALAVVLCWGSLKGIWLKNFGDPADYMLYVEEQALANGISNFSDNYSTVLDNFQDVTAPAATGTTEIQLQLSDTVLALLEQELSLSDVDVDLAFLQNISMKMQAATNGDMTANTITLYLDGAEIANLQQYNDPENDRMLIGLPGIAQGYAEIPVAPDSQISLAQIAEIYASLPSAEVTAKVIDTYMNIILDHMDNVEKENETVELGDVKQKMTVLTMKVTEEDCLDMMIEILETAQDDENLEEFLDDLSDYANSLTLLEAGYLVEQVDLHKQLMDSIPEQLEMMEAEKDSGDFSRKNYLKVTDYVNSKHEICGRTISVHSEDSDTPVAIHYLTVNEGDSYATEFRLSSEDSDMTLEGSYTIEDGLRSGSYEFSMDDEKMLTLELTDCNAQQFSIKLTPSEEIINDAVPSGAGALVNLASPSIELSGRFSDDASNLKVVFTLGGQEYVGITMDCTYEDLTFSQLPEDTYWDATDGDDLIAWFETFDLEGLSQKLIDAGVPEEVLDELMYYLVMYM